MAIKKDIKWNGLSINGAYIRIEYFYASRGSDRNKKWLECEIGIAVRVNQHSDPLYVSSHAVSCDPDGGSIHEQIYRKLKLLPAFSSSIDVLEMGQVA